MLVEQMNQTTIIDHLKLHESNINRTLFAGLRRGLTVNSKTSFLAAA